MKYICKKGYFKILVVNVPRLYDHIMLRNYTYQIYFYIVSYLYYFITYNITLCMSKSRIHNMCSIIDIFLHFLLILAHIKCVVTLTSWSQSRTHRMCSNMTISQTYCPLNNVSFEYSLRFNLHVC